ncbi:hypothetical protein [Companilactobacillus mishanensis]|uniref:Uncharacterized protein n=1 Tax=Companilactobacillus mishanensis TaxID=2486008 RepID=A0ABW9P8P9_9LACO|nr:hypothetical protein [Companilactobacillus mishanensis]MQS45533.1 hypothetical protein [Companilactobacillus mishanensis]MQS89260.1 hypothetical protein [Companilactobacillus mishanensis]
MDGIIIFIDVVFLVGAIFSIYWQSQIEIRATYRISALIFAGIVGAWLMITPVDRLPYIFMVAEFVTLTIMNGVGGIGNKKIILSGFYSGVLDYSQIVHVTLIPIQLPGRNERVAVIFNTNRPQQIELNFKRSYKEIEKFLEDKLSKDVQVEIGQV